MNRLSASISPTSDRAERCRALTAAIDQLAGDLTGDATLFHGRGHSQLVVVTFDRNEEGDLVPGEGTELPSAEAAGRRAGMLAPMHAGAGHNELRQSPQAAR